MAAADPNGDLTAVAVLDDPVRRALYRHVVTATDATGTTVSAEHEATLRRCELSVRG